VTRFRLGVLLAATLVTTLASGCTSVSTGDPRPAESAQAGGEDTTTTSTPPTRPREIPLSGVDPCTLLPQNDYADFDLDDKPGEPGKDKQGAANCLWQGDIGYMSASLITYEGVQAYEGRYGQFEPADPIDDFPAFTIVLPNDDNRCFVVVDVADGQYLKVQAGLDVAPTDRPTCEYAHDFATSIMSTLVQQ
jgi:hypothetical protein